MKSHGPAGMLFAAVLALFGHNVAAQGRPVAESDAPRAWVAYAQAVSLHFQAALVGDSEPAQRFNAFLDARDDAAASDAAAGNGSNGGEGANADAHVPATLRVKAWFDASGHVTRVEFPSFGNDAADTDLRTLLTQQQMNVAPPRGMRQPVVVRIGLAPAQ